MSVLFSTPPLTDQIRAAVADVDAAGARLHDLSAPPRWLAVLRRSARGQAISSSVAIEGFRVEATTASAIAAGERTPSSLDEEVVAAYGRAMDHVVVFADDPLFKWNYRVLADLHFDLAWPHRHARAGRLREQGVWITSSDRGVIYTAPDAREARVLVAELVTWLRRTPDDTPLIVRAAMAHLHLVSIHPFVDGNGRASRVLQSLVLALGGRLAPELASIESYLAQNTAAYYAALHSVQGATYDPTRDATPWLEFCATAHAETAKARVKQLDEAAARWSAFERFADERGWPDRLVIVLEQALAGTVDRAGYALEAEVSTATASTDLRRVVDAGLIASQGAGRSTAYVATDALRALAAGRPPG